MHSDEWYRNPIKTQDKLNNQRVENRATHLGISIELMRFIEGLEARIDRLERAALDRNKEHGR